MFQVSVTLRELGLTFPEGYFVTDLFDGVDYGVAVKPDKRFKVDVNPSGIVLVRCEIKAKSSALIGNEIIRQIPRQQGLQGRKLQNFLIPFNSPFNSIFSNGGGLR